ncbi:hypothetical protein LCGC14_1727110 [marine sediment metagenome]|uniref:Terminase large subunit gp17-like C-terminal domain-containing protein n=1 Tax=marine sediment metagenome TaxID=412755 RepID=A0A0F9KAD3_9ZZZZ
MAKRGRPSVSQEEKEALRETEKERLKTDERAPVRAIHIKEREVEIYLPPPPNKKGTPSWRAWAMAAFEELLRHGLTMSDACRRLGVTRRWWETNSIRDPEWATQMRAIRSGEDVTFRDYPDLTGMSYSEFALEYLGLEVFEHQQMIVDALEDPQMNRTMVLGFPESGKSTHVSLGYVIYRLCRNPDIRIAIVSKSQSKAQDILHRIKRYLTEEHLYEHTERNLIRDFKGFEPARGAHRWDQTQITIRQRKSGERDPTIQALGVGTQIYGARIDLLIMDDSLTLDNQLTEKRRDGINSWFLQEAASRAHRGQIIVCGTRVHPYDNYQIWKKAWENDEHFRLVRIPAITTDDKGQETSSWPSYWPLDGEMIWDEFNQLERYQKGLRDIRDEISSVSLMNWRLAYQQEDVQEVEAIFTIDRHIAPAMKLGEDRMIGQVMPEEILILGIDPALTGRAAAVMLAYNTRTRIRTVVDLLVLDNLGTEGLRKRLIYPMWEKYRPQRTVIEINYAPTLMGDEAFKSVARAYGTLLQPHSTVGGGHRRGSKWDDNYGVAAIAPLMSSGLYAFPSLRPEDRNALQPLLEDMQAFPYSEVQDAVMAVWFCEGEVRFLHVKAPDPEKVIEGRALPPRIARRLRGRGGRNRLH